MLRLGGPVSGGTTYLSFILDVEEEPHSSWVKSSTEIRGYTIIGQLLIQIAGEGRELMGVESALLSKTNFFGWACIDLSQDYAVIGGANCGEAREEDLGAKLLGFHLEGHWRRIVVLWREEIDRSSHSN